MKSSFYKSNQYTSAARELAAEAEELVVFDLETTGLDKANDRIIELAALRYNIEDGKLKETNRLHIYINPERPLLPVITELTGITDEMLSTALTEEEVFKEVETFFRGVVVAGYNIDNFDVKFMENYYGRMGKMFVPAGTIDGIKLAREALSKNDVENFKLGTVAEYYGIHFNAHEALEDARATAKVIEVLLREDEAEENCKPTGTLRPTIRRISFWEGFRGFSRVYVSTNMGDVYYDVRNHVWGASGQRAVGDINAIDMAYLEKTAWDSVGASNADEFVRFSKSAV